MLQDVLGQTLRVGNPSLVLPLSAVRKLSWNDANGFADSEYKYSDAEIEALCKISREYAQQNNLNFDTVRNVRYGGLFISSDNSDYAPNDEFQDEAEQAWARILEQLQ